MDAIKAVPLRILGVNVSALTVDELNEAIYQYSVTSQHQLVLNVNIHALNLIYEQPDLRVFFNKASIVFVDGAGVKLGAMLLGYHLPPRITYADWMWQLAEFAEPRNLSFYFLGARPGIAEKAARMLQQRHPGLQIAGCHHGYFNKKFDHPDNKNVVAAINQLKPNILIVAFGMPMQERWLMQNWDQIDANVALTGGAAFDYVSGELQRASNMLTRTGFEWLGRLIIEPKRLWRRYLIGNPLFLWRLIKQHYGHRRSKS